MIFDEELILPGVITEILPNYGYGYDTSKFGTTKSVTVIGTAFDGPVGKPVPVYSPEHARYMFGPTYDSKTRREASLVSDIQDAWDKGCRTIYAVRVSGKSIFKDFQFGVDTPFKLRVSGIFPSNGNKDINMVFDNSNKDLKIKIFKPAVRATIQEKMQGLVEKENSILATTIDLSTSYGIQKDSRIMDLISIVNENISNNVLRLSIVNNQGVDVTMSSQEAQFLSVGDILPGLYLIGRDENRCIPATDFNYVLTNDSQKPYDSFDKTVFKELKFNTDVSLDLPIYGSIEELNEKFNRCGVTMTDMFDILETPGQIDFLYGKDSIDYEEVDIKGFDLYQRLGSGFAITAKAVAKDKEGKDIRVIETPASDENRISPIKDGIYSMLENLRSDYRVITTGVADEAIAGKIPKKEAFKTAIPSMNKLFDIGKIEVKSNNDLKDLTKPKKYRFELRKLDMDSLRNIEDEISTERIIKAIGSTNKIDEIIERTSEKIKSRFKYDNGTLILDVKEEDAILYRYSKELFSEITDPKVYKDLEGKCYFANGKIYMGTIVKEKLVFKEVKEIKEFMNDKKNHILIESDGIVSVYKVLSKEESGKHIFVKLIPIGEISRVLEKDEDKTLITVQNEFDFDNVITINTSVADYTTLGEFVEILNEDNSLSKLFKFNLNHNVGQEKDFYLEELFDILYPEHVDGISYNIHDKVSKDNVNYVAKCATAKNIATKSNAATNTPTTLKDVTGKNDATGKETSDKGTAGKGDISKDTAGKGDTGKDTSGKDVEHKDVTGAFNSAEWEPEVERFKTGEKYVVGNIVFYEGKLYICQKNYPIESKDFKVEATEFWKEYILPVPVTVNAIVNKFIKYNTSLYIPYKTTDTFDRHLAQHCTYTSLKTSPTHGIIGCSKVLDVNLNSVARHVNNAINLKHKLSAKKPNGNDMLDKQNMPYLVGRNVSVVFGPQYTVNTEDNYSYISNGAAGYAGMVSSLPLDQSSTSQPIDITTPMYELTNYQLEKLTQAGFITFKQSYTRGFVVTDGVTMDEVSSPYRRLSVTRIVNEIENVIREAVEPFIGQQNHLANQNSMQTAIKSKLDRLKGKLVEAYDFNMILDEASVRLGIINIDYVIIPIYEIREVRNRLRIKDK